eukprot:scaffold215902_cov31-Tisochrysis_lutea.AAC.4
MVIMTCLIKSAADPWHRVLMHWRSARRASDVFREARQGNQRRRPPIVVTNLQPLVQAGREVDA